MKLITLATLAFSLLAVLPGYAQDRVSLRKTDKTFTLVRGSTPILTYHKAEVPPPKGIDRQYRRSGFIYPLHAPGGGVVTSIHAEDHYHHLGLWHAWVRTEYGDPEVVPDFWNLGSRKVIRKKPRLEGIAGRVRYTGTKEIRKAGFTVKQEQVAYLDGLDKKPTVILGEAFAVDAAFVDGANVIDYVMIQTNVTKETLTFSAYRYGGGIAYRGPSAWNKTNSDYLTSEGLDRTNSHATRARWVAMFGPAEKSNGKDATVAILCHPDNHDAPQRVRTWDKGPVFFNYVPIQETAWSVKPGETNTLAYRIVILDGRADAKTIEKHWKAYAK